MLHNKNNPKQLTKTFLVFTIAFLFCSCVSYVGIKEMRSGLDELIGTNYSTNTKLRLKNWSTINETDTHLELEQSFPTGCSYAILINKKSDIIESWRLTSDIDLCEQKIYVPGV